MEGGSYIDPKLPKTSKYKNRSGCCCLSVSEKLMTFEEACAELFHLAELGSEEARDLEYFQSVPKKEFLDFLNQLQKVSGNKNDFIMWIQDITGSLEDSRGRRLQF